MKETEKTTTLHSLMAKISLILEECYFKNISINLSPTYEAKLLLFWLFLILPYSTNFSLIKKWIHYLQRSKKITTETSHLKSQLYQIVSTFFSSVQQKLNQNWVFFLLYKFQSLWINQVLTFISFLNIHSRFGCGYKTGYKTL